MIDQRIIAAAMIDIAFTTAQMHAHGSGAQGCYTQRAYSRLADAKHRNRIRNSLTLGLHLDRARSQQQYPATLTRFSSHQIWSDYAIQNITEFPRQPAAEDSRPQHAAWICRDTRGAYKFIHPHINL